MKQQFVYADSVNVPEYMIMNGRKYLFIKDHRGSVNMVVDSVTGEIKQQIKYSEFGEVLQDTNPGFQPFGFAGGLYDYDTKLVRFGARDYDGKIGRWLSKDPIRFDGGTPNLYEYTFNDPVNFVDPEGKLPDANDVACWILKQVDSNVECGDSVWDATQDLWCKKVGFGCDEETDPAGDPPKNYCHGV